MSNVRAVEHVGLTVPDLEQATTFFAEAFGAQKIYDMLDEPFGGPDVEKALGIPQGAVIEAIRMMRLGNGPNLELFTYTGVTQRDPVIPSDYGIHALLRVRRRHRRRRSTVRKGGRYAAQPPARPARRRRRARQPIPLRPHPMGQHRRTRHMSVAPGLRSHDRPTPVATRGVISGMTNSGPWP